MPKGQARKVLPNKVRQETDIARATMVREMFEALAPYAVDCAKTAGMLGAINKDGTPGHLTAAVKVMDFLAAHAGTEQDDTLDGILRHVERIRRQGMKKAEIEDEPGESENGSRPLDPDP